MVPGIPGHWIIPCKVLFIGEKLSSRVSVEQLEFWPKVSGVRVEPITEPLLMQHIMAGSEAPPPQREVRPPQYLLGGSF